MYNYKRKKQRRLKKYLIFFIIIISLWFCLGLYLNKTNSKDNDLENIGYSNIEINMIEESLNDKQIKIIKEHPYNKDLTNILSHEDIDLNKLENYLNYYYKYPYIEVKDLVYIINNNLDNMIYNDFTKELIYHKDFKRDKANRYNDYYDKYRLNINDTIYGVNLDLDLYNIKYEKVYDTYIKETMSIKRNLNRYYQFSLKNKKLTTQEIITKVNNNLDLTPYVNIKKTDISKNIHILVNRYYYVDKNYTPNNLVDIESKYGKGKLNKEAYDAFINMYEDAKNNNVNIKILEAYISYEEQEKLYNRDNNNNNYKPGYNDSITGLGIKLNNNSWLKENAYKYGFIIRYKEEHKDINNYYNNNYYRYVGKDIASFLHNNNITFDEYYEYFINK